MKAKIKTIKTSFRTEKNINKNNNKVKNEGT